MKTIALVIYALCFLSACAILNKASLKPLSLQDVLKLNPQADNQNTVTSLIGFPDKKIATDSPGEIVWIYNDKVDGYHRLSLVFDETQNLQSVLWLVRGDESEIRLKNSIEKFPLAKFTPQDAPWENPHAAPDERFYMDEQKGISITLRKTRNEVHSIGLYNPAKANEDRKPANIKYEL